MGFDRRAICCSGTAAALRAVNMRCMETRGPSTTPGPTLQWSGYRCFMSCTFHRTVDFKSFLCFVVNSSLFRSFLLLASLAMGPMAQAQGGIRVVLNNFDISTGGFGDLSYGLGYDHDFSERTSFTVLVSRYIEVGEMEIGYRSNYHFMDNDGASFYMGPNIALRTGGDARTGLPIGMHMGVRGGLQGFYADLFAGVRYRVGSKELGPSERLSLDNLPGTTFMFGLHFGIGWD